MKTEEKPKIKVHRAIIWVKIIPIYKRLKQ